MKVIGLFSGTGIMERGFEQAGFDVVASNEVDPTMCKTLEENFSHHVLSSSVHELSVEDLRKDFGQINGVVGGFPCVSYSKIANLHGTRVAGSTLHIPSVEKYPKYSRYAALGGELFLHYFRIIASLQPDFFVVENVPGILSARIVRETFRNTPCNSNDLGYYYMLYEGILNTRHFGLPQDRPRYFFVGSRKKHWQGLNVRRALVSRKLVVGDILEPHVEMELPDYVKARIDGKYRDKPIITEAGENAIAPTCVAHYAKDRGTRLIKVDGKVRPYTTLEYARLQGFPDNFYLAGGDSYKYLQIGNAVSLPVAHSIASGVKELLAK